MEKTFSPLVRQFSAIEGLQAAYTLVYSLDAAEENGCRLTLCRTGAKPCIESVRLAASPEDGYRLLRFLSENVIQPEAWCDVLAELCPQFKPAKGGAVSGT